MGTRAKRLVGYAAAALVLAAVFTLYTRPEFMVNVADVIWACFQ